MTSSRYSLAWAAHKRNICGGLSSLQQNGEFVDMTLAADGHLVKVHQVMIALASPYIKELISSAQCPHPVIFLNKISYKTLGFLLEYIYTGEVMVSAENIDELIEAGKDLHIKGLVDMKSPNAAAVPYGAAEDEIITGTVGPEELDDNIYFEITTDMNEIMAENVEADKNAENYEEVRFEDNTEELDEPEVKRFKLVKNTSLYLKPSIVPAAGPDNINTMMQYTVSNRGSLQMILNRFIYYLKHSNKDNTRQWRCVDYLNTKKCPALVNTKDNIIIQRISSHTHPFHDDRIMKKVKAGTIYSALHEAEEEQYTKKAANQQEGESTVEDSVQ